MGFFDINYNNLVPQLVPVRLRQNIMLAWLRVLASPVVYLKGLFDTFRSNTLYQLNHNGQVCYLQAALNDTFDNRLRRIYISDGAFVTPIYFPLDSEIGSGIEPICFPLDSEIGGSVQPIYFPLDNEVYTGAGVDFIVNVPAATLNTPYMEALINQYKLAGKQYSIVTF